MKNLFKKIGALLVAAVMVLSMCTAVFADDAKTPSDSDSEFVTITGVENGDGITVKAYQLVDAEYANANGFTGYVWTANATSKGQQPVFVESNGEKELNISSSDVTAIANSLANKNADVTFTLDANGKSSEKLTVGTWLLVVEGGTNKIYNPMLVSVYYTDANDSDSVITGPLNATAQWALASSKTYVKVSDIEIKKTANKDTQKVGQSVSYKLEGTIPAYNDTYTNPFYTIEDNLTNLKLDEGRVVVKVGGDEIDNTNNTNYILTKADNQLKVEFTSTYVSSLKEATADARKVEITYTATVAASASNFNAATNTVSLNYTNKKGEKTDATRTYTFDLNGQIKKIGEDKKALGNAEFALYKEYDKEKKAVKGEAYLSGVKSDKNGNVVFKGLEAGTYYLQETKAPEGYQLSDIIHKIVIEPTYEDSAAEVGKKELKSYTITISDASKENDAGVTGKYEKTTTEITPLVNITNTKLGTLPSTGGMGTYLFTIIGVVVMAGAAGAFFISRRKGSEE